MTSTNGKSSSSVDGISPAELNPAHSSDDEPTFDHDNLLDPNTSSSTSTVPNHLTFLNGLALVISLQIGSGIFSAPVQVSSYTSSPVSAISAWLLAGGIVYTGAMSFVELGITFPHNGGVQEYLRAAYGDFMAALFTWMYTLIAKPCAMAVISMVSADYLLRVLGEDKRELVGILGEKMVALLSLGVVTAVNCYGVRAGAVVANGFLVLKLFTLFSIAIAGLTTTVIWGATGIAGNADGWLGDVKNTGNTDGWSLWKSVGRYITALYGVLFCYGGWETIGFVAGEMKNPTRDLPRVLNTAMLTVVFGSILFNIALYCVVPFQEIRDTKTPVVELATRVFGEMSAPIYSVMVAASAMGALNANVYATGRLYVSAADRGYFPAFLSKSRSNQKSWITGDVRHQFPVFIPSCLENIAKVAMIKVFTSGGNQALRRAMITNSSVASIYLIGGTFDSLLTFIGISEFLFFFLAVAGVSTIRKRFPQLVIYKTQPWHVAVFCTASFCLVLRGIITSPFQGLSIAVLVVLGWIINHAVAVPESQSESVIEDT